MAHRAGARLANLEYVQFHPTSLYHREADSFLISEAVRGEGARLMNLKGEYFMEKYSPLKDLAPRDEVSRAIYEEMIQNGNDYALLDLASFAKINIRERFPTIFQNCLKYGINIEEKPIPVVPAAHYSCGGVLCDLNGRSSIRNLYAIGEVSATGVHGANRLASVSLLEALVWGVKAAEDILAVIGDDKDPYVIAEVPGMEISVSPGEARPGPGLAGPGDHQDHHVELQRHHPHRQAHGAGQGRPGIPEAPHREILPGRARSATASSPCATACRRRC